MSSGDSSSNRLCEMERNTSLKLMAVSRIPRRSSFLKRAHLNKVDFARLFAISSSKSKSPFDFT